MYSIFWSTGETGGAIMVAAKRKPRRKDGDPDPINYQKVNRNIRDVLGYLENVLKLGTLRSSGDTVFVRLISDTENRFFFWRGILDTDVIPRGHPREGSSEWLGEIDRTTGVFDGLPLVRSVSGLSKVKVGGEKDLWASTLQDNLYVKGAAVSLHLDARRMSEDRGGWDLIRFLNAALMLEPVDGQASEYITLSNVFDSTP